MANAGERKESMLNERWASGSGDTPCRNFYSDCECQLHSRTEIAERTDKIGSLSSLCFTTRTSTQPCTTFCSRLGNLQHSMKLYCSVQKNDSSIKEVQNYCPTVRSSGRKFDINERVRWRDSFALAWSLRQVRRETSHSFQTAFSVFLPSKQLRHK